jgi:hypothetical protein
VPEIVGDLIDWVFAGRRCRRMRRLARPGAHYVRGVYGVPIACRIETSTNDLVFESVNGVSSALCSNRPEVSSMIESNFAALRAAPFYLLKLSQVSPFRTWLV